MSHSQIKEHNDETSPEDDLREYGDGLFGLLEEDASSFTQPTDCQSPTPTPPDETAHTQSSWRNYASRALEVLQILFAPIYLLCSAYQWFVNRNEAQIPVVRTEVQEIEDSDAGDNYDELLNNDDEAPVCHPSPLDPPASDSTDPLTAAIKNSHC